MSSEFTGSPDETADKRRRVDHHLGEALARSDDREVNYHIREALHLLRT